MRPIILASASPRRKELLEQIGLTFECCPAKGEEYTQASEPSEVVQDLAAQKALEIAAGCEEGIIIGADTVVSVDGQILGKPENEQHARRMIEQLQGRTHEVYTGVCLLRVQQGKITQRLIYAQETKVEVYPMSQKEVECYIQSGEGVDKAGAYAIQGAFAAYIKGIIGDYYNVVGLPVASVYQAIKDWL